MKKRSKSRQSSVPKVDPYLEGLMAKLLERLVSLEKKIDALAAQTGGKAAAQTPEIKQTSIPPRRDRVLYEAICADCHKVCEVPFKPSEDRAVYCKECFARRKSQPKAYPVLTPVALPPKPAGKLNLTSSPVSAVLDAPKKVKKGRSVKKTKKKK